MTRCRSPFHSTPPTGSRSVSASAAAEHEFQQVFVGLTGGAIIPFASWYRERRLMGLTLVRLRGEGA